MKGWLTVEQQKYHIPLSVTISRKTGQVTKVEYIENGTLEEFMPVYEWMKEAGEAALAARRQDVLIKKGCENAPCTDFVAGCATRGDAAAGF